MAQQITETSETAPEELAKRVEELESLLFELRNDYASLSDQNIELQNREYAMRQELAAIFDKATGGAGPEAQEVCIGKTIPLAADEKSVPFNISHKMLQRSVTLLGKQGSGKTTFSLLVASQLLQQGVGVMVFDKSGEWRPLFKPEDTVEMEDLQFNPFDPLDGLWTDQDLHEFIKNQFFSFMDSGSRSSTNLGSISVLLNHYFGEVPAKCRNISDFANFIQDRKDILEIPAGTVGNLLGYLRSFIHDPKLASIFDCDRTSPKLKRAILESRPACIVLNRCDAKLRSIISVSVLMQVAKKLQKDFHQKGSTMERPLTAHVIVEETADIVRGTQEKEFFKEQLRDSRKFGLSYSLFPRSQSNLKQLGITNILEEVGVIACFPLNEHPTVKHADYQKALKSYLPKLKPGMALFLVDGKVSLVKCDNFYQIRKEAANGVAPRQ